MINMLVFDVIFNMRDINFSNKKKGRINSINSQNTLLGANFMTS